MMKSTIKTEEFRKIYEMLDRVSPIDGDCGELCGACCCTVGRSADDPASNPEDASGSSNMGIYLLPGEEKLHSKHDDWLTWITEDAQDYEFPDSWTGKVNFISCKNPPDCPREKRPIQCRTFPLVPHIYEDGELTLLYNDMDLPYRCPLIEEETPLNEDFVQATKAAWERLVEDPLIYDLVRMDSEAREQAVLELAEKLTGE